MMSPPQEFQTLCESCLNEETSCHDIAYETDEGNNVGGDVQTDHRLDDRIDDHIDDFL